MNKNSNTYDLFAEKMLLALVFQNNKLFTNLADLLNPDDFYDQKNIFIFTCMKKLNDLGKEINAVSIYRELEKNNLLSHFSGIDEINKFYDEVVLEEEFDNYVSIVKDHSVKRNISDFANKLSIRSNNISDVADSIIDYAEEEIYKIAQSKRTSKFIPIKDVADEFEKMTIELAKRKEKIIGLDYGFKDLTDITSGFQKEQFIIVAARPGVGKSAFALNLAYNIASDFKRKNKKNIAFFSLEMSNEMIVSRLVSLVGGIEGDKLRTAKLDANDFNKLDMAIENIKKLNILFDDSSATTVSDVRTKCRKLYENEGLDLVIIDYLQLLNEEPGRKTQNRQETVSRISRGLKELARELKIPVIALSQLSRDIENMNQEPKLSNLRESGSLEQDADMVFLLFSPITKKRPNKDNDNEEKNVDETYTSVRPIIARVAKNRQGRTGDVHLAFNAKYSKFNLTAPDYYTES